MLTLDGPVDLDGLQPLLEAVLRHGHEQIVVDLSRVQSIEPAAVNLLLRAWATQRKRARDLVVVGANAEVRWMFQVRGLECLLSP